MFGLRATTRDDDDDNGDVHTTAISTSMMLRTTHLAMTYEPPCRLVIPLPSATATVPGGGGGLAPSTIHGAMEANNNNNRTGSGKRQVDFVPSSPSSDLKSPNSYSNNSSSTLRSPSLHKPTTTTGAGTGLFSPKTNSGPTAPMPIEYTIAPTGVVLEHQYQKEPTMNSRIAWFATNLPRHVSTKMSRKVTKAAAAAAVQDKKDGVAVTASSPRRPLPPPPLAVEGALRNQLTSRDLFEGRFRGYGWVEPPVFPHSGKVDPPRQRQQNEEKRSETPSTPLGSGGPPSSRRETAPPDVTFASDAVNALLLQHRIQGKISDNTARKGSTDNGPSRASGRLGTSLPTGALFVIFRFCGPDTLDRSVVYVCRRWHYVVVSHALLQQQRFTFEVPTTRTAAAVSTSKPLFESSVLSRTKYTTVHNSSTTAVPSTGSPVQGILYYMATRGKKQATTVSRPSTASAAVSSPSTSDARYGNPAYSLGSVVSTLCVSLVRHQQQQPSRLIAPSRPIGGGAVTSSPSTMSRLRSAGTPSSPKTLRHSTPSVVDCSTSSDPRDFTSHGPSTFTTPDIPFAWAGIELIGGMKVIPTGYSFCSSIGGSLPTAWELQGCTIAGTEGCATDNNEWATAPWHMLHVVNSLEDAKQTHKNGITSSVSVEVLPNGCKRVTCRLEELQHTATKSLMSGGLRPQDPKQYGAMRRFRLVQTARNEQWGEALTVSGFELFGWLFHQR